MPSASPPTSRAWIVVNCAVVLLLIGGGGYLIATNEEAAEVAGTAFWGGFTFFTTPFVLETTVAILAILAVGIINQRRLEREGDGWVYLPKPEDKSEAASKEKQDASLP